MDLPERVTVEQAAEVFRRAAELEAVGPVGSSGPAVLDADALEDIGREVGLSSASVRAALAELRGGVLDPGPQAAWGTVTASRSVPGERVDVIAGLDDEARRDLLTVVRREGDTTVWAQRTGTGQALVRRLRGRRHHPLLALGELRATVVESRPGLQRVTLQGFLIWPWRLLSTRAQVATGAGVGGGTMLAIFGAPLTWTTNIGFAIAGGLACLTGAGVGLRSYRRTVARTEWALVHLLDRLVYGIQAVPAPRPAPELLP